MPYRAMLLGTSKYLQTTVHLTCEQPIVQFVVEDLEYWDEPVIAHRGERIPLEQTSTEG